MLRWQTYDPWRELRALQRQMDDVFRGLAPESGRGRGYQGYGPALNVREENNRYLIEAEVAGFSKDDINIEATGNTVTIRGKREVDVPEGYSVHRQERGHLEFARTLTFESKIDLEKLSAQMRDGVLRMELHKQPDAQPRQIAIQA